MKLNSGSLPLGKRTVIMGILNVTPDSFYDGGRYSSVERAVQRAQEMIEEGADIIDVGGESTRPGAKPVSEKEELSRVIPVITRLKKVTEIPISIDTYKAVVAERAIQEGAQMINDVWGGKADYKMVSTAASHAVPICLMHNRQKAEYRNLMEEIISDLRESINLALKAGVKADNIIIDPGIGFGKTTEHNLEVMNRLEELKAWGYPLLLGTSRKSMIGNVLQLPLEERLEGTAATVALGISKGADIVRVHDVKEMRRVVLMTDAMVRR